MLRRSHVSERRKANAAASLQGPGPQLFRLNSGKLLAQLLDLDPELPDGPCISQFVV
jgi:hypothetical protein